MTRKNLNLAATHSTIYSEFCRLIMKLFITILAMTLISYGVQADLINSVNSYSFYKITYSEEKKFNYDQHKDKLVKKNFYLIHLKSVKNILMKLQLNGF